MSKDLAICQAVHGNHATSGLSGHSQGTDGTERSSQRTGNETITRLLRASLPWKRLGSRPQCSLIPQVTHSQPCALTLEWEHRRRSAYNFSPNWGQRMGKHTHTNLCTAQSHSFSLGTHKCVIQSSIRKLLTLVSKTSPRNWEKPLKQTVCVHVPCFFPSPPYPLTLSNQYFLLFCAHIIYV